MKPLLTLALLALMAGLGHAQSPPEIFTGLFVKDTPAKGEVGIVVPPAEMDKYIAKVAAAARQDPEWYKQYALSSTPGVPLPFHEKLQLTKEEYADYLKLWGQREFKVAEEVMLLLRESFNKTWIITGTGRASSLSTLRYDAAKDSFVSPNGDLKRITDIDAGADSILGAWKGKEWKFEEETGLGKTKENFALGRYNDGKNGVLIYRVQELSSNGTHLLDKSLIIRFPLPAAPKK